ncbi:MAG TPA: indolepyruvate oxidoreductase subunit beta family protein [Noviherbaspirillum sp.]|jgi:indolepyruvate ferredoxin oxidoreductase beta subunit|uniref:indolepyruvate oxidoreductase subunit beta family protein n=1 Tax=Noviherbaspirillum sp. TaxID=1926288 RepID=UPI002DDCCACF|nr:indolepyruvate oxidoreductase subunit beta family protein [Noviherbaspirillum sp.]HEV2610035.1 indolepyruvate oxidoreductase subunit beta family protein [Noviherbaspirillum sp.]
MDLNHTRPVTILIAALGGEGGGVLADWLVAAASVHDFPVQSTSIPGVAQRTGATTYYIEIFPVPRSELDGRHPVMSLTPMPGDVDVAAASELLEAGRLIQSGFIDPSRTALIASSHREYAVVEKSSMGDGRFDGGKVLAAAKQFARTLVLSDLKAIALKHGTVINTVMFGAMAGAGALPVSKAACLEAIRRSGKAVEASLQGFEAGFDLATSPAMPPEPAPHKHKNAPASARLHVFAEELRPIVQTGTEQVFDYQDAAYANAYLDRVEAVYRDERDAGGGPARYPVTRETARYLALWMSYEDVIRVADLKTRKARFARVRTEVGARDGEPLRLTEYLKPGLDEMCSILPTSLADRVHRRYASRKDKMHAGLHVRTDTVSGFLMLCALRSLRRWRPRTSRFAAEQRMIARWLDAVRQALVHSTGLAYELALCGNLVKGYGETSERGHRNLTAILADVERNAMSADAASRVRRAREAALADPEGRTLAQSLGLPAPAMVAKPVRFVRNKAEFDVRPNTPAK